jgi:hypothetical protein
MLRLSFTAEPVWIDLFQGVRVQVLPYGSAIVSKVRARLRREAAAHAAKVAEGVSDLTPELEDMAQLYAEAVAVAAILDWDGVVDDATSEPLPVCENAILALMSIPPISAAFQRLYIEPGLQMVAEKNVSSPSPNGTTAEAMVIAVPAKLRVTTVPIQ